MRVAHRKKYRIASLKVSCFDDIQLLRDKILFTKKCSRVAGVSIIFPNKIFTVVSFTKNTKFLASENLGLYSN